MRGTFRFGSLSPSSVCRIAMLCALLAILGGCATHDERLLGSWKRNRAQTLATLRADAALGTIPANELESLVGEFVVTYERGTMTGDIPSSPGQGALQSRTRYSVIKKDANSVHIAYSGPGAKDKLTKHIYFDGRDRFWTYIGNTQAKECYDRIKDGG